MRSTSCSVTWTATTQKRQRVRTPQNRHGSRLTWPPDRVCQSRAGLSTRGDDKTGIDMANDQIAAAAAPTTGAESGTYIDRRPRSTARNDGSAPPECEPSNGIADSEPQKQA